MTSNGTLQDVSCASGVSMRVPQIGRSRFALPEPLELPGSGDVVVHTLVHATPCGWKPRPDTGAYPPAEWGCEGVSDNGRQDNDQAVLHVPGNSASRELGGSAVLSDRAAQTQIAVEGDRTSQVEAAGVLRGRGQIAFSQTRKDRAGDDGKHGRNDAGELGDGGFPRPRPGQSGIESRASRSLGAQLRRFRGAIERSGKTAGFQVRSNSTRHTPHGALRAMSPPVAANLVARR